MMHAAKYGAATLALAAMLGTISAVAAPVRAPRSYILNGYSFGGLADVDTHALEAKLKHHRGARITEADIKVDAAILARELKAQHIEGHLFTTMAEKKGHIWIIFDVLNRPGQAFFRIRRHLEAQHFEGPSRISERELLKATGLRQGETLSPEKVADARQGIMAAYAKALPRKKVTVRVRMQGRLDGSAVLTWVIQEPG